MRWRPGPPRTVDTTSVTARMAQVTQAVVLSILAAVLMITTHRVRVELGGVDWPVGLLFGAVFQVVCCVFAYASTGARLPLLLMGSLWGPFVLPFLARGAGGGVLLPAEIAGQVQYSGWVVQLLGIGIPFVAVAVVSLGRRRRVTTSRRAESDRAPVSSAAAEPPSRR